MPNKIVKEFVGKPRAGFGRDVELAFDPEAIVIRVDGDALPPESVEYVIRYGFRQAASDRAAGSSGARDVLKAVDAFLEALKAGEPVRSGGPGYTLPKIDVETVNVLVAALRKRGMKAKEARDAAIRAVTEGAEECNGIPVEKAREVAQARIDALGDLL